MTSPRILVIFAGWVPNSEDKAKWASLFSRVLADDLGTHDKILIFNHGCDGVLPEALASIPNVVTTGVVEERLNMGSDASGYQLGLALARSSLDEYDSVLFVHSKGASRNFIEYSQIIEGFRQVLFPMVSSGPIDGPECLFAMQAFLTPHSKSIRDLRKMCEMSDSVPGPSVTVTSSIYAVSASVLGKCLSTLPDEFFQSSLEGFGFDPWFFESVFPGVLVSHGADIRFAGKNEFGPWPMNPKICYHAHPRHNGAVVEREIAKCRELGSMFVPTATPYVFNAEKIAYDQIDFISDVPKKGLTGHD